MAGMENVLIAVIIFVAMLVQTTAGFGMGLVSMPLMLRVFDPVSAAALVSLVGITSEIYMIFRYRHTLQLRVVLRLIVASLFGIPFGVHSLGALDSRIILTGLGIIMIAYSLYGLLNFTPPVINSDRWGYAFGFVAGLLSGAYNTSGPPLVIYGTARRWSPAEFKVNLQMIFLSNSVMVIAARGLAGHYTLNVLHAYLFALPALVVAAWIGLRLDQRIDPVRFRTIVLVLLLMLGVRMLLP
jgi:hypothetical protein